MILIELFAGVGGFRLGFEGLKTENGQYLSATSKYTLPIDNQDFFITGFSNQFEPSNKRQHASEVYLKQFWPLGHYNSDITQITGSQIITEVERNAGIRSNEDLVITGGFPCQDYSVGTLLKNSKGLNGKKGVLWWEIYRLTKELSGLGRNTVLHSSEHNPPRKVQWSLSRPLTAQSLLQLLLHPSNLTSVEWPKLST